MVVKEATKEKGERGRELHYKKVKEKK